MSRNAWLAAGLLAFVTAGPVIASPCSDAIATLDGKVKERGEEAISASSAGQADAAARGGQGRTGASGESSAAPPEKSAEAGKGADKAQAAKIALDEARSLDGKGDAKGCEEAVSRVKKSLSETP